jgi:Sec-independent protein translocase protein TatA
MLRGLEGWHFIVIALVVLVIWGGPKLPTTLQKTLASQCGFFAKKCAP